VNRYLKIFALVAVLGLVGAACAGGEEAAETTTPATTGAEIPTGGVFKMALLSDVTAGFDPQKEYYAVAWAYYRGALLRTLVTYDPNDPDSTHLYPDLAAEMPEVSADGLTWTFKLKQGLMYAPPFEDVEITTPDIVRALQREFTPAVAAAYGFYYNDIEGTTDYYDGKADTISGLETPDNYTLIVHLTRPAGDLGFRLAMPATAPIPPLGDAVLGAADGHDDDYGRFLVASGPYMFQGSEAMDFSVPAKDQEPAAGYQPGKSIILVRNPSWAQDDIRKAYVEEIDTVIGGTPEDNQNKIDAGELNIEYDGIPPGQAIREYSTNPDLQDQLFSNPSDGTRFLWFNLAVPPFDDVHIRKAINFALDKEGMRRIRGGETVGDIATHIIPNSLLSGLLDTYDPYPSPNYQGDPEAAKAEIALSTYDKNQDGSCEESPECQDILTVTDEAPPYPDQAALIEDNLAPLGITLDVKAFERSTMYNKYFNPAEQVPFGLGAGWFKDYADAYTFLYPLFYGPNILDAGNTNYALVGADPDQLKKYGYTQKYGITEVPSLDDLADECFADTGDSRTQCFADFDKALMEDVVPYAPFLWDNDIDIISSQVVNYVYSGFDSLMALDQVACADATCTA
jgi:peptide/nickel transport system substrate-binding protein